MCTSNLVPVKVEIVQFADPKFETWMVSRYDENKDGKIQISEIPSELEFNEQDMFDEFNFDDCSILYPENIDCIESVRITSCGNVKASQFKGMKNISSITSFSIGGYVLGVNDIEELLSYFPNVKELGIGGEYHPGSGGSSELIKNCEFLDKFSGIISLDIDYVPAEKDLEHIIRHKDSLTNLSIDGVFRDSSIFDRTLDYTKLGNLKNLKDLRISDVDKIKDGLFINKLDKLENLYLGCGFNESFNLSNQNVKYLELGAGLKGCDPLDNITFGNLPNVETLGIASSLYYYGPVSYAELNSCHLENMENLKSLSIAYYKMDDLSFLSKLTNLESINLQDVELESTLSLPNLENLDKLIVLGYSGGNINDISNLEELVNKDTFKRLYIDRQYELNPNSKNNLKIIEKMEDRKKTDKTIVCEVEGYRLKDFVNDINNAVGEIATVSMGVIKTFRPLQTVVIEKLITEENFPILESYDVNVVSGGGAGKSFGDKVGSKDKIQIVNTLGEIVQEYTVIIPGDVTGNGEVKLYDAFKILNDSVKKVAIDELDVKIRDYNEDEKVTTYDALQYMKETMKEE